MSSAIQIGMNMLFSALIVAAVCFNSWAVLGLAAFAYAIAEANYRLHHMRKS